MGRSWGLRTRKDCHSRLSSVEETDSLDFGSWAVKRDPWQGRLKLPFPVIVGDCNVESKRHIPLINRVATLQTWVSINHDGTLGKVGVNSFVSEPQNLENRAGGFGVSRWVWTTAWHLPSPGNVCPYSHHLSRDTRDDAVSFSWSLSGIAQVLMPRRSQWLCAVGRQQVDACFCIMHVSRASRVLSGKESACQSKRRKRYRFSP